MSHCEPTTLALVALGEDIPAEDAAHLASCEACLAEAAELAGIVTVGREAPIELPEVPTHVWEQITAELGHIPDRAPDGDDRSGGVTTLPTRPAPADAEPELAPAAVVPLQPRRRGFLGVAAVAAAAGALLGGAVVWAAVERDGTGGTGTEQFVAQAVLDPLDDRTSAPGEATVVDGPDGTVVRVDATALPDNDGFYEVWLLDADATRLVALGALPAGAIGTFTVPPGLSLDEYPVVDISLESYDGDPGHSSDSLMRGILEA